MKNILNLSVLNIKRSKQKIKIYIIIITMFITLTSTLINTSNTLNECITKIVINNIYVNVDYEIIVNIKYIVNILIGFIIIFTFIFIDILSKQSINDRFYDIAICKSVGYKDKYIFQLLFYELYIITTLSYLLSIIPSFICMNSINLLFLKFNVDNNNINIIYTYILPLLIIYSIILISSFKAFRKSKKIPINILFNEK